MKNMASKLRSLASIGLVAAGLVAGALLLHPQTSTAAPPDDKPGPPAATELKIVVGKVVSYLRNDHDDVDGLELAGEKLVHFPPHIGKTVIEFVSEGDEVRALGRDKTLKDGREMLEIVTLECNGRAIAHLPSPPKPHGPEHRGPEHQAHETMSVTGAIADFHVNKGGDVDGFILNDDAKTEVKFPPHMGDDVQAKVAKGDHVTVVGDRHETPHGDVHLHAKEIKAGDNTITVERPEPKPHDEKGGHKPKKNENGKKHEKGPKGDDGKRHHDEIMRELREIRALILSR